ncbi:hypothetical protein EJC49_24705 [Aquibium carbonis]|uniref:Protein L n=1 Tax=Aquibium carbonis TaxID=2495581 RepID=A0A429YF61_9HYPH|nr:hypothetical protein EJC49_24705 [Aquibium carbonis]
MALYRDETRVKKANPHSAFETVHKPGVKVPYSGIYRCVNCGDENCCNKGDPFPPQNHHQHQSQSPIGWQLLVMAVQK